MNTPVVVFLDSQSRFFLKIEQEIVSRMHFGFSDFDITESTRNAVSVGRTKVHISCCFGADCAFRYAAP